MVLSFVYFAFAARLRLLIGGRRSEIAEEVERRVGELILRLARENPRWATRGSRANCRSSACVSRRARCVGCSWRRDLHRRRGGAGRVGPSSYASGSERAGVRLLHCRDGLAAPLLRPVLHRARKPTRPPRRLHSQPDRRLGHAAGAQPELHLPPRADAVPDPRSRQLIQRQLPGGVSQRRHQGDLHASARTSGKRLCGSVRTHQTSRVPRLASDPRPRPPRTRAPNLHRSLRM